MARSFSAGSSQYCESSGYFNAVVPITIAAMIRPDSTSGVQRVAAWTDSAVSQCAASIILNFPSAGRVANQVLQGATHQLPSSSGTFTAGNWHHAAVVSGSTASRTYLDGVAGSDATYSTPTFTSATFFSVGRRRATEYYSGRVAELGVWAAELSAAEVGALADGYTPLEIRPDALIAYYPLGGHYGQYDLDRWKNKYDLTPVGATWADHGRVIYPPLGIYIPPATVSSNDRTASITGTMGAMSASLSAGFTKPTFAASITGTNAPMTAALSASRTLPTFTGSIVATHAPMTAALSATFTQPVDTAAITATNAAMSASVAATFGDPEYTATIAATNAPMSAAVSATFDQPTYTASIAATLAPMTSTISATSATEIDTASIVATLGAMTASLTAAFSDVIYVTTECGIVPHFTRSTVPRFRRRNILASIRRNTVPRFRRARR